MAMLKYLYLKRKSDSIPTSEEAQASSLSNVRPRLEINLDELPIDPGRRKNIYDYDPNDREKVRRFYLLKKACQPNTQFPWKQCGGRRRRFISCWYKLHPYWLEYSTSKDSAYCLCCYLFKTERGGQSGGDAFVTDGFSNWKDALMRFKSHVGDVDSIHNNCVRACQDLMNQKQHIEVCGQPQKKQSQIDYRTRLVASIDVAKMLLRQALSFRGHDESEKSLNWGNFLEFLRFLANHNEDIDKVTLNNAPKNNKLTSPDIQKDTVKAIATETTKISLRDFDRSDLFSILVDESRDISVKEQMVVLIRFVNTMGCIVECFLGVVHVRDTTSPSLKVGVEELLAKHDLSIANIRGQGYDGASNMRGEFNGLKALILRENPCAFYVHCFAHQLQLAVVGLVKKDKKISMFFVQVSQLLNVVAGSCRRRDLLRDKQTEEVLEKICNGVYVKGKGLNQEATLKRAGETRWGSHYLTLMSLIKLWNPAVAVLIHIMDNNNDNDLVGEAETVLGSMSHWDFVFFLHFLKNILGKTERLSQALQRSDQDIVGAVKLVKTTKRDLMNMRNDGWEALLDEVNSFCLERNIDIVDMSANFIDPRRVLRQCEEVTNLHHYRYAKFNAILDSLLMELDDRFREIGTELLSGMACLDPQNSFDTYNVEKLINFAKLYPLEFSSTDIMDLELALPTFILDVRHDEEFSDLDGIAALGRKMVQTGKHLNHPLVYSLLKLAMLLPVATAGVERAFSAMHIVKTKLRNRIGDDWLNDLLVAYIEREALLAVDTENVIVTFQGQDNRRGVA